MTAALQGIRVADFSHVIAGPFCAMILADMGAEVVKIEPRDGDAARSYMQLPELAGESSVFLSYNRNKKGIALDLGSAAGREIAREIVMRSDVLVENFATGVMQRLGLDYESLRRANPRLVYCAISGYGRSGNLASRAAFDPVVQAESGFMSLNGFADRDPLRTPIPLIDVTTGMFAVHAILGALYARQISGQGQYVEVALFDNVFALNSFFALDYLATGKLRPRLGNKSVMAAPADLFDAADGKFFMSVASERVWAKLVAVLDDAPELRDPAFATNAARMDNEPRLREILQRRFAGLPMQELMKRFHAGGVPAAPVRTLAEAVASSEAAERGIVSRVPHSTAGSVPNLRLPFSLEATPLVAPRAAPALGEHTRAVLGEYLGYGEEKVDALAKEGVIGLPAGPAGV